MSGSKMEYQICIRCIMDTTDPDIVFDKNGICNHCKQYDIDRDIFLNKTGSEELNKLIMTIKEDGKGKEYDCVIGVSGGVDSTFVAYKVKELGLTPLAVHLDNGWNSELAVSNIEKVLKKLNIDLYTHVIDWEEFKDLQLSFLKASVANCEIPTDHAIPALLFSIASKKNIKYIILGSNIVTEGILPPSWGYDCTDLRHIKGIYKKFGKRRHLKTYPTISLLDYAYYIFAKKMKKVRILNYINYNKNEAMELLTSKLGWKYYGGKHYESIFTRFFQGYYLPEKFGFDKRRAHLSTLICSRQIIREEALQEMCKDPYPPGQLKEDREYVIKKFGLTEEEWENIMSLPIKSFKDYPSNYWLSTKLRLFVRLAKKLNLFEALPNKNINTGVQKEIKHVEIKQREACNYTE